MEIDEVPKDAQLHFWDGKLWIRWEDSQDLPGPERDPLRIKVARRPSPRPWQSSGGTGEYTDYVHD